jgi:hypothetical protein
MFALCIGVCVAQHNTLPLLHIIVNACMLDLHIFDTNVFCRKRHPENGLMGPKHVGT